MNAMLSITSTRDIMESRNNETILKLYMIFQEF